MFHAWHVDPRDVGYVDGKRKRGNTCRKDAVKKRWVKEQMRQRVSDRRENQGHSKRWMIEIRKKEGQGSKIKRFRR